MVFPLFSQRIERETHMSSCFLANSKIASESTSNNFVLMSPGVGVHIHDQLVPAAYFAAALVTSGSLALCAVRLKPSHCLRKFLYLRRPPIYSLSARTLSRHSSIASRRNASYCCLKKCWRTLILIATLFINAESFSVDIIIGIRC